MEKKQKIYIVLLLIFIFTVLAGLYDWPDYFNTGIAALNSKLKNSWFAWLELPNFPEKPFLLGLDLQGGIHLLYEADLSQISGEDRAAAMDGLRDVIERRVNLFGVREPIVQAQEKSGHWRLIVELAGITDPNKAIEMIGQTPFLEFREQRTDEETEIILAKQEELKDKSQEELQEVADWQLAFQDPYFKPTPLTGKYLKRAELGFDQTIYKSLISLQFNDEGAKIFEDLTESNVGKPLAIYIDGVPISSPVVQEKISGGRAQITGDFTVSGAKDLVRNLNAGALPMPITLVSQQSVGPTLGAISLQKSLKAGIIGFLAVILFMLIFYRLPGLLASFSLTIYAVLVLALVKLIPITLTLPGIAGFILSIGMAIDANILIFARLKEELKEGKSFLIAIQAAFSRAWPSIRDGNLTTLIAALILFAFGTGFVKGFALTLGLGILLSLFSGMVATRVLLELFEGTRLERITWLWR